jgi:hypothetical protein
MRKIKNLSLYAGIGALAGCVILLMQILLLVFLKESHLRTMIAKIFSILNKPIEVLPCLKSLAEMQSPLATLSVLICYWVFIGVIGGFIFGVLYKKLSNR